MKTRDLQTVRSLYDAFARRDLDAIHSCLAPDIVVEQPECLPWGGRYVGHDGFNSFIGALLRRLEPEVETTDLFDAGDQIVHIGRSRGKVVANGGRYDVSEVHLWTFRDGQVTSLRGYVDIAILAALTASAQS